MAVLSDAERVRVWRAWMRKNAEACGFNKTLLRTAVDATDDWIDQNAASFNLALPVGIRGAGSTTAQKTLLFCYVALNRAGLLGDEGN